MQNSKNIPSPRQHVRRGRRSYCTLFKPCGHATGLLPDFMAASRIAAFGITTLNTSSVLNRAMFESFGDARGSKHLILRLVVFEDEATGDDRRDERVAVLKRPWYLPWQHLQCTQKILRWLEFAMETFPAIKWIGQMDSDSWFVPQRLVAYLRSIDTALPSDAYVWGGMYMHWQRLDTNGTLGCVGFSGDSPGSVTAWHETEPAMLRRSEAEKRAASFAHLQGGFYFYSRTAASTKLVYVHSIAKVRREEGKDGLYMLSSPPKKDHRPASAKRGQYTSPPDPCDAILGWLGARAFEGKRLYSVAMHQNVEYYSFPVYGRFNPVSCTGGSGSLLTLRPA